MDVGKHNKATSLVDTGQVVTWWECIFKHAGMVAEPDHFIEVRKIGLREGQLFQESMSFQPWAGDNPDNAAMHFVAKRVFHAAENGVGAFMSPSILSDRRATDESVKYLLAVTVDLDTGDTFEKLGKITETGLRPTLIVASGGETETLQPKLHIHFRLSEPCDEPWKVAHVREVLAARFGGDGSFKRIPQVVRIPGSVHDKDLSNPKPVLITHQDPDAEHDLSDFCEILGIDFNNIPAEYMWSDERQGVSASGEYTGKDPEKQKERLKEITGTVIHEGGTDDTRFQRFTEYAGRMIMHARLGEMTVQEAYGVISSWNETNVSPPWPEQRVRQEFEALLRLDRSKNPEAWSALDNHEAVKAEAAKSQEEFNIDAFIARDRYKSAPPEVPWIIDNMIIEKNIHALVADGGVGKTYLALDMGMRIAAGVGEDFLG